MPYHGSASSFLWVFSFKSILLDGHDTLRQRCWDKGKAIVLVSDGTLKAITTHFITAGKHREVHSSGEGLV